jgi:hypothetical protein
MFEPVHHLRVIPSWPKSRLDRIDQCRLGETLHTQFMRVPDLELLPHLELDRLVSW